MKIKQSLLLISMVLISLLAISAVSAEDNGTDIAAISDADDSADVLSVDENDNQVSVNDVEKENVVKEEVADDSDKLGVSEGTEVLGFGSGNGTKFDFKNITFDDGNGTKFNLGDLFNGTFTLGNGTQFNFSSLGNGTLSFGNGTSFNMTSLFNGTGGNGTFDISSILNMFGGTKLTATSADMEEIYSGAIVFEATVLESNKTVDAGKDVIFTINNKDYLARTNANGTASVSLNLKAGSYYIYTEYNNEILAKNQIVIKKADSKITASAKSYKAKTKIKKYAIILKNSKGKAIKKAAVTLKIKGKTYKATTNNQGKAIFKITKFAVKGKHAAKIRFGGDGYYKASSVSKTITIK